MKRLLGFVVIALAITAQPVQAEVVEWKDNQITDIIDDVKSIKNQVTGDGNLKLVGDEFRDQHQLLQGNGLLLRDVGDEVAEWLQARRGPYLEFVGSPKCAPDTTVCGQFRNDLMEFFTEFATLRENFPVIERLGYGDGSRAVDALEISPPIMLFGLHEVLGPMDQWRAIPDDLQRLFDEIADPEVFSDGLDPFAATSSSSIAPLAVFPRTPTQRFCERHANRLEREIDPVRLRRLKFYVNYLKTALGLTTDLMLDTIGLDAFGFGTDAAVPNPVNAVLKITIFTIDLIQGLVGTFRANLDLCRGKRRELELQVAQCIELVDFVKPTKRDEVNDLVIDIVDKAEEEGVSVSNARKSLNRAESHRDAGRYKEAYLALCDAYQKIGT